MRSTVLLESCPTFTGLIIIIIIAVIIHIFFIIVVLKTVSIYNNLQS